ncbi:MAG TPA: pyridoxamine 5'-phosphate oxidase [Bacteroidia bacterium]|nr:pyridoxamine 5'-phosphate oxidase [Bacteroidia bacterium]
MDDLREHISKLRSEFSKMKLDESMADSDPVNQFAAWLRAAMEARANEPNAMVVSTVGADNRPSARVMLLRSFDHEGFIFYTNYNSRKGKEIAVNPHCALTFFWPEVERQVRIEGKLSLLQPAVSDLYFMSRPAESRLGAWASPQSEVIGNRRILDDYFEKVKNNFAGKEILRPEWWGGYVLNPDRFEFWQGREKRLHDRLVYIKHANGWSIQRLAP